MSAGVMESTARGKLLIRDSDVAQFLAERGIAVEPESPANHTLVPRFWSVAALAKHLSVSQSWVRTWIKSGKLKAFSLKVTSDGKAAA